MKRKSYALKGSLRRVMAFLLIFVILVTSDGMTVFARQDEQKEEQEQNTYIDSEDMQVESTDSLGTMLLEDIEEKTKEAVENACAVFEATVSGNTISFDIQTLNSGTLIAAIYDDAGEKLIKSGKTEVTGTDKEVSVIFDEGLPEYFYLRAYIVDDELAPQSEVYECPLYTRGMQGFLNKTVYDFEPEDVLNLDEDPASNFLVYQDEVIRIREAESSISLLDADDEKLTYVFDDPLNELSEEAGIKKGNFLSFEKENGEILVIAIDGVSRSGTELTLDGTRTEKQEVFKYIKIDSSAYATDIDNSGLEEGVTYEGSVYNEEPSEYSENAVSEEADLFDGNASKKVSFAYKLDKEYGSGSAKITFKGSISLGFEASIKYYFEILPWLWNGTYCEVKLGYNVTAAFSISGSHKIAIPFGVLGIMPIPGVFIEFTPSFVVETSASITISATYTGTVGFRWEYGKGVTNLTKGEAKTEIKGEITIFFGLSLEPKVKILCDEIAKLSVTAKAGIEMKGSISSQAQEDKIHGCTVCLDGDTYFKATLSLDIQMIWGALKFSPTLAEIKIKIGDWYSSKDIGFGFGTCPNEYYKITYVVRDAKSRPVKKVKIQGEGAVITDAEGKLQNVTEVITDTKGEAAVFQKRGVKSVRLSAVGYADVEIQYDIPGEARKVNITLPSEMEKQYGGSHPRGGDPEGKLKDPVINEDGSITYSTVYFGNYWQNDTNGDRTADCNDEKEPIRWRVLKAEEKTLFLLADENLDSRPFAPEHTSLTWETSDMRRWLNTDFYFDAFSLEERKVIESSILENANSRLYRTPGGRETQDFVFLLSEAEASNTAYGFTDSGYDKAKVANNTPFAKERSAYMYNILKKYGDGGWWLRSPGKDSGFVEYVNKGGYIALYGDTVQREGLAVRPAVRIQRSSKLYFVAGETDIETSEDSMYSGMDDPAATTVSEAAFAAMAEFAPSVTPDEDGKAAADYSGLISGERYNFYAMKNEFEDDRLSDENLMYISQGIADEEGKLAFSFMPKEVSDNIAVFVVGPDKDDEEKSEPVEPTEPVNPADPTEPAEPVDSAEPEENEVKLTGISIDRKAAEMLVGDVLALGLGFTPEDATNKKVVWSSSDEKIATVADGAVTAVKEGKAIIKAVSEDGGYEATCEITVKSKEGPLGPDKPDLSKYTASGNEIVAKSINLKKTIFRGVKGIKKYNITGDTTSVKIKGSMLTVLKDGTVTVTAFNKSKEKLAVKTLTLIAPDIETTQPTEINRRGNLDLNKYISSTVKPAKWKSSSKKIAEVSRDGLLTMKKSGKVKITVTFPAEKGMKAKTLTIKLNIKMPQFKKTTYTVKVGKYVQTAVKNADTTGITYKTENLAVATVDATGKVTGVSKGTTKLIMTVKGIDYETKIKVK